MSWFGKMVGGTVGLMIGGPLGAIAGGAIGHHLFDKGSGRPASSAGRRVGYDPPPQWGGAHQAPSPPPRQSTEEERQATFFLALFSILGKLAKADGTITRDEGEMLVQFIDEMDLSGREREFAIKVFNEAKNSRFSASDFARQFAGSMLHRRPLKLHVGNIHVSRDFLDVRDAVEAYVLLRVMAERERSITSAAAFPIV